MIVVIKERGEGVKKNRSCLIKHDAVLGVIIGRLFDIPFESQAHSATSQEVYHAGPFDPKDKDTRGIRAVEVFEGAGPIRAGEPATRTVPIRAGEPATVARPAARLSRSPASRAR